MAARCLGTSLRRILAAAVWLQEERWSGAFHAAADAEPGEEICQPQILVARGPTASGHPAEVERPTSE